MVTRKKTVSRRRRSSSRRSHNTQKHTPKPKPKSNNHETTKNDVLNATKEEIYDTVIVGGGIAGLYRAYCILRKTPDRKLLLVEKQSDLGGRIYTYKDNTMTVETGAGRFSNHHKRLWKLIHDLGLKNNIVPIRGGFSYIPSGTGGGKKADGPEKEVAEVIASSRHSRVGDLRKVSFLDYAKRIVGTERAQHIVDSFGYYSELVIMNAYDAIRLMKVLDTNDPSNRFYVLSGGLSQIIERLEATIRKHPHVEIRLKTALEDIQDLTEKNLTKQNRDGDGVKGGGEFRCSFSDGSTVVAKQCILALPKPALERLSMFRPLKPYLDQVSCGSLCRIYSQFAKKDSGWLKGLSKITTNNDLRMIIPVDADKGIVMISYTDNKFADTWHDMYKQDGVDAVNKRLRELVKETLDVDIAEPIKTKLFYWRCGVGYWNVGANSTLVAKRIARPLGAKRPLYVCGEHFSEMNQQWMEGGMGGTKVPP
jgi:monoamine oxidase